MKSKFFVVSTIFFSLCCFGAQKTSAATSEFIGCIPFASENEQDIGCHPKQQPKSETGIIRQVLSCTISHSIPNEFYREGSEDFSELAYSNLYIRATYLANTGNEQVDLLLKERAAKYYLAVISSRATAYVTDPLVSNSFYDIQESFYFKPTESLISFLESIN